MRAAVREHLRNPPAGSKLRAAVDFGVDITLMQPPWYSDKGGRRANVQFGEVLAHLATCEVQCVIIGGLALVLHGSTRVTFDIDIFYERSRDNVARLVAALAPFSPKLRLPRESAPVPFTFDAKTIWNGANFTLETENFDVDILATTEDLPSYRDALQQSQPIKTYSGDEFNVLSLEALLRIKKRINRVKDQLAIPEIEALIEIRDLEIDPGAIG
jgi:hypothetical protein